MRKYFQISAVFPKRLRLELRMAGKPVLKNRGGILGHAVVLTDAALQVRKFPDQFGKERFRIVVKVDAVFGKNDLKGAFQRGSEVLRQRNVHLRQQAPARLAGPETRERRRIDVEDKISDQLQSAQTAFRDEQRREAVVAGIRGSDVRGQIISDDNQIIHGQTVSSRTGTIQRLLSFQRRIVQDSVLIAADAANFHMAAVFDDAAFREIADGPRINFVLLLQDSGG